MRFYFHTCLLFVLLGLVYSTHQSFTNIDKEETESVGFATKEGGLSRHAKEVLLKGARERLIELKRLEKNEEAIANTRPSTSTSTSSSSLSLPPLESLVNMKNGKILQDVQFLLDFAVVGFGKCGTTTLLQWLTSTNPTTANTTSNLVSVRAPNYEAQFLVNQRPEQLVRKMHQFGTEEQELRQHQQHQQQTGNGHNAVLPAKIFKGFKNPSDIRRQKSRDLLKRYWPHTPLVVTVRNPINWLVSIYNYFKIEKGRSRAKLDASDILDRGGRDVDGNTKEYVSTAKGEFHAMLAELGKTPLILNSAEMELLAPWLDLETQRERIIQHRLPNPIFFMEMGQLVSDTTEKTNNNLNNNSTLARSKRFANDLESFLGLPHNYLPPLAPHVRPRSDSVKLQETTHLKMNICEERYRSVLDEMVQIARSASTWFQEYFIQSPDVTVSNPDHLIELLEQWKINPCDNKKEEEE